MLLKDIFEWRHYGPRKRNVDITKQEHRNRISKKPTADKRKRDRLKRHQQKRANVAVS